MGLSAISLFSGAGGLDIAARWSGIRTVCYVEIDRYAQAVLMSRIRSGDLDDAPIWDDVTTFDGKPWNGKVDIVFGGFPCQDLSTANYWREGLAGKRSGLWSEFARVICEVGPKFVIVENVPGLLMGGAIGIVLGSLAEMGFDAEWGTWGACAVGAPHTRERVFIVAYSNGVRWASVAENQKGRLPNFYSEMPRSWGHDSDYLRVSVAWSNAKASKGVLRLDDGMAQELDGIRLSGNGVCPQQALPAFQKIIEMSGKEGE